MILIWTLINVLFSVLMSYCDVPCMSGNTFQKNQSFLAPLIKSTAWSEIERAAREERRIAVQKGNADSDGIPYITVVADGAWCKRSYRTSYDALSGVVSKHYVKI